MTAPVGTGSIRITVDTSTVLTGIRAAARQMSAAFNSSLSIAGGFTKVVGAIGLATAAVGPLTSAVGGLGAAVAGMAGGAAALLPGIALAGAAVIGTLKLATSNFSESTVGAVVELRDQITASLAGIRDQVQRNLFDGLAESLKQITGTFIPAVRQGMFDIASAMNGIAKEGLRFLGDPKTVEDTATGMSNTARAVTILQFAVEPVIAAFRDLAVVGSSFLPSLANGFVDAAREFQSFIARTRETGQLQAFITNAGIQFGLLVQSVKNFGSAFGGIFSAAGASGMGFLTTLERISGAFAGVVNSRAGQSGLTDFFAASSAAAKTLSDALSTTLPPILAQLGPLFGQFAKVTSGVLATAFTQLVPVVQALAPVFFELAGSLGGLLTRALEMLGPILVSLAPLLQLVGQTIATTLNQALSILGPLLEQLIPVLQPIAQVLGEVLYQAFLALGQVIAGLAPLLPPIAAAFITAFSAVGPLIAGLAPQFLLLLPPLTQLATDILPVVAAAFASWLGVLLQFVTVAMPPLVSLLSALFGVLADNPQLVTILVGAFVAWQVATAALTIGIGVLRAGVALFTVGMRIFTIATTIGTTVLSGLRIALAFLTGPIGLIIAAVSALVAGFIYLWNTSEGFRNFFIGAWEQIKSIVGGIINGLITAFRSIGEFLSGLWQTITAAAVTAWTALAAFFQPLLDGIVAVFQVAWDIIRGIVEFAVTLIAVILFGAWNLISAGVTAAWTAISDFFASIWPAITAVFTVAVQYVTSFLADAWARISSTVSSVWNAILAFFTPLWNGITSVVTSAANGISSFLSGVWDSIRSVTSSVWNAIKTAIVDPIKGAWDTIVDVFGGAVDWFSDLFNGIVDTIGDILGGVGAAVSGAFSGLGAIVKAPINAIISLVNGAIRAVNSISVTIPDWVPGVGGQNIGFNLPQIPSLALGGVVRPMPDGVLVRVAEAGRPERVEPLDSDGISARDMAIMQARMGGQRGDVNVVVMIDGEEFRGMIRTEVQDSNTQTARALSTGRKLVGA